MYMYIHAPLLAIAVDTLISVMSVSLYYTLNSAKKTPVVSKRVDEFRARTQPQIGKVHDP